MSTGKPRVCVIGAGPSGMSTLWYLANKEGFNVNEVVCYEKQDIWGGLWNYTWRTGTDEFGEHCHGGQYRHLFSNGPKECLEYPDYTFEEHFGKPIPSFPPRTVLRDYLEGRWTRKSKVDLKKYVKFNTVVRNVKYNADNDSFTVDVIDLKKNSGSTEVFTHVVVGTGIFNNPNFPSFPGIETFPGRVLHSHNFRNAEEYKGQRLLIIGSRYSAEDISLQCMKYGAKSVTCTYRSQPMGFKWPEGISERPLVERFEGTKAFFKDGTSAEFDAVIFCTGYLYTFPFMDEPLRLKSASLTMYADNLYKGTLWLGGGNNKVFYIGTADQYYSYTMLDVQAVWACQFIMRRLPGEPKSRQEMEKGAQHWIDKRSKLKDCHDEIDFESDFIADLSNDTGYSQGAALGRDLFHTWEHDKVADIATYRDKSYVSIFTGNKSPLSNLPWWKTYDDSIEAFCNNTAK